MTKMFSKWLAAIALVLPLASHANVLQFNASLSQANEIGTPSFANASASGLATLFYDTVANSFSLSLSAFNLSSAVTGAHIHAPANTAQNGPVLVNLNTPSFIFLPSGNALLVGGNNVASPASVPAFGSYSAQSFVSALQSGLAYVNVHTANNPGGEIRGQFMQVAIVPELETYVMFLAGIGLFGVIAMRRRVNI